MAIVKAKHAPKRSKPIQKRKKSKGGRPSVMSGETVQKLEQAFALDCTDEEACIYAGIAEGTLYNYQKEFPEFLERKKRLKAKPVLLARKTIVNNLATDVKVAQWYAERKLKEEFSPRTETALSGEVTLKVELTDEERAAIDAIEEEFGGTESTS